jgi:hypothetical protein
MNFEDTPVGSPYDHEAATEPEEGMSGLQALIVLLAALAVLAVFLPVLLHIFWEITQWSWELID